MAAEQPGAGEPNQNAREQALAPHRAASGSGRRTSTRSVCKRTRKRRDRRGGVRRRAVTQARRQRGRWSDAAIARDIRSS